MQDDEQHRARIANHDVTINIQTTTSEHWIFLTITPPTTTRATSQEHLQDPVTNNLLTTITRTISNAFDRPVARHEWERTPHQNRSFHALLALPRDDRRLQAFLEHLRRPGALEDTDARTHAPQGPAPTPAARQSSGTATRNTRAAHATAPSPRGETRQR